MKIRKKLLLIALNSPETYMERCIQLAASALGKVAPNPMVGCVIVKDGEIIAEGVHQNFGLAHAEASAIQSVGNPELLRGATLYVNLEPCSHHGKTPPCCDKIIAAGISEVVYADSDPNDKVVGKGGEVLRNAGVLVRSGVLREKEKFVNRRFRTFHIKKRPYIILKWAQSADGFMDIDRTEGETGSFQISNQSSKVLLHKWRSEEQAILIGTNTARIDNPRLNVRLVKGKSPLRLVIDRTSRLPRDLHLLSDGLPTIVYNESGKSVGTAISVKVDFKNLLQEIMSDLYTRQIQSVMVEGGSALLNSFIQQDIWDEIRVFVSDHALKKGLKAPVLSLIPQEQFSLNYNQCFIYRKV